MLVSKNGNHIDDVERLDMVEGEGVTLTFTNRPQNDEVAIIVSALTAEQVGVSLTPTVAGRNTVTPGTGIDSLKLLTGTTFSLTTGGTPKYSVPSGSQAFRVDDYGNVYMGKNVLAPTGVPATFQTALPDFMWCPSAGRLLTRNLIVTELDDPANMDLRRAGPVGGYPYAAGPLADGTSADLTGIAADVVIGQYTFTPFSAPLGGDETTPGARAVKLSAQMYGRTAELARKINATPDRYAVGGEIRLMTVPVGHDVGLDAVAIHESGAVEIAQTLRFGLSGLHTINTRSGSDGVTNGTTTFVAATGAFTAADVGKSIVIGKATTTPDPVYARIAGYTNSTTVTLSKSIATATGVNWRMVWSSAEMWQEGGAGGNWTTGRMRCNAFLESLLGLTTKVKAGTPADGDYDLTPNDGTLAGDSTASKLWVRLGGTWKGIPLSTATAQTYTQTYATADRTLNLVSTSAFTGQDNLQAGTVYAKSADLEQLRQDHIDLTQMVNAIVDDLQARALAA